MHLLAVFAYCYLLLKALGVIFCSYSREDRSTGTFTYMGTTLSYSFQVNAPATIMDWFFLYFMDVTGIASPDVVRNFNMYTIDGVLNIKCLQQGN